MEKKLAKPFVLLSFEKDGCHYRIVCCEMYDEVAEEVCSYYELEYQDTNSMHEKIWRETRGDEGFFYEDITEHLIENYVVQRPQAPVPEV